MLKSTGGVFKGEKIESIKIETLLYQNYMCNQFFATFFVDKHIRFTEQTQFLYVCSCDGIPVFILKAKKRS